MARSLNESGWELTEQAAEEDAKEWLENLSKERRVKLASEYAEEYVARLEKTGTAADLELKFWRLGGRSEREDILFKCLSESARGKDAWHATRLIAQEMLRTGAPLPADLAKWVANYLEHPPPKPPKGKQHYEAARDFSFRVLVLDVSLRSGLKAARSRDKGDQCSLAAGSACDVVGLAMGIPGYPNAERIWMADDNPYLAYYRNHRK